MSIARLLVANRGGDRAPRLPQLPRPRHRDGGGGRARRRRLAARAPADEVVAIASYLHSEEHVRAAREAGADAIHPGCGFLAESADFAEAVNAAGLTWVRPPPEALRLGGDKLAAKRIAREAGVPVLPDGDARRSASPLLVKAAAGGGGRGMRVVRDPEDLDEALAAAEREAAGAFVDGTLFCERYLERPRRRGPAACRRARERRRPRRARLLGSAPAPEGAGGGARPCARGAPARRDARVQRSRSAGRSAAERRDGRVRPRGGRVLLPRARTGAFRSSIRSPRP